MDWDFMYFQDYCCPVNFKTAEESSPKPFRIGLRAFFFEKQAPLIKLLLSGKSFTRQKIRLKPTYRISASFVVHPIFGVMHQLPEDLFRKCTCLPTRTRSARVRCFSFFAFTSSPQGRKKRCISDLLVKASPLFPSPVKAKKRHFLHTQNTLYQRIAGKGEG